MTGGMRIQACLARLGLWIVIMEKGISQSGEDKKTIFCKIVPKGINDCFRTAGDSAYLFIRRMHNYRVVGQKSGTGQVIEK